MGGEGGHIGEGKSCLFPISSVAGYISQTCRETVSESFSKLSNITLFLAPPAFFRATHLLSNWSILRIKQFTSFSSLQPKSGNCALLLQLGNLQGFGGIYTLTTAKKWALKGRREGGGGHQSLDLRSAD